MQGLFLQNFGIYVGKMDAEQRIASERRPQYLLVAADEYDLHKSLKRIFEKIMLRLPLLIWYNIDCRQPGYHCAAHIKKNSGRDGR